MARHILAGRVTPKTASELQAIVIGLASIRDTPEAQSAFDRLNRLPIVQMRGDGLKPISGAEIEALIRHAIKNAAPVR